MSNKDLKEKQKAKREAERKKREEENKKSYQKKLTKLRNEIDEIVHNKTITD